MECTRLGSSGLKISRIALGTMGYGDGSVPLELGAPWDDAKPFFTQAFDLGIPWLLRLPLAEALQQARLPAGTYAEAS